MGNITVICSWCGRIIYKSDNVFDDFISHGICSDCSNKIKLNYKKRLSGQDTTKQVGNINRDAIYKHKL